MNRTQPKPRRQVTVLAIAAALFIVASTDCGAFCPKNGFTCVMFVKSAGGKTHQDITQLAIEEWSKRYFGIARLTKPMQKALDQIIDAGADVDNDQITTAKHFDAENGVDAQSRLSNLTDNILSALNADPMNATSARENFGSALHTLQDFYAHTSWVESGQADANPDLGRGVALPFASSTTATCVGTTDPGFGCAYSSTLVPALLAKGILTSGYYSGQNRSKPTNVSKCSHGGPLDKSSPASDIFGYLREGINKDTRYCDLSPHSGWHDSPEA